MAWTSRSQYEAVRLLGEGGFGRVALVRKLRGGEFYAVKEVNLRQVRRKCGDDKKLAEKCVQMATNEANIMMALQHQNVIRVFGHFTEIVLQDEVYHMVMEFCEGGDLEQAIEEGNYFDEELIRSWVGQIASALQHLHRNDVAHRDIKTDNIFLFDDRKTVKLGDFGISKNVEEVSQRTLTAVGTAKYSAPEWLLNGKSYTFANDAWAFGIVTFRTASLTFPFREVTEILRRPLPNLPSKYSKELGEFIEKLLAIEPDARPTIDQVMTLEFLNSNGRGSTDSIEETVVNKPDRDQKPQLPETITESIALKKYTPELLQAAKNGKVGEIERLVKEGANVNVGYETGFFFRLFTSDVPRVFPLHAAAIKGHYEIAELLIKNGADVNAKTEGAGILNRGLGWTALHYAAREGRKEVAVLLIENGADVNARSNSLRTPLHNAAEHGHLEIASLLIENGADINAKDDEFGYTALHWAALKNVKKLAVLLVEKGADVTIRNTFGQTAHSVAMLRLRLDIMALLKKHENANKQL